MHTKYIWRNFVHSIDVGGWHGGSGVRLFDRTHMLLRGEYRDVRGVLYVMCKKIYRRYAAPSKSSIFL